MIYITISIYFIIMFFCVCTENRILYGGKPHSRYYILKHQKRMLIVLIILIAIVSSFRSITDIPDQAIYHNLFLNIWQVDTVKSIFTTTNHTEIGFQVVSKMIKFIFGNNYSIYCFIISLIILILSSMAIWKLTDNRILAYFIYFSVFGFYYTFIVIRQGIAMAIILYTLASTCKGQRHCYVKFIIGIVIASLFHITAIVCILMFPFIKRIYNHKTYKLVILTLLSIIFTYLGIFATGIATVMTSWGYKSANSYLFAKIMAYFSDLKIVFNTSSYIYILTFFIVIVFLPYKEKKKRPINALISIQCLGITLLGLLSGISESIRIADYFLMSESCTLSSHAVHMKAEKKIALITFLCLTYIIWRFTIIYKFNLGGV